MADPTQVVEPVTPETTTQAVADPEVGTDGKEFDAARAAALIEKLRTENKTAKAAEKKLAEYEAADTKRKKADLSDLEKANKKALDLEAQLKVVTHREMQRVAAVNAKLPVEFSDRLRGETAEELEEDAKKLLAFIPAKPGLKTDPTNPGMSQVAETFAQKKARLSHQSVDFFGGDPQTGVIYPPEG